MSCAIENTAAAGSRAMQRQALEELTNCSSAARSWKPAGEYRLYGHVLLGVIFSGLLLRFAYAAQSVGEFTTSLIY